MKMLNKISDFSCEICITSEDERLLLAQISKTYPNAIINFLRAEIYDVRYLNLFYRVTFNDDNDATYFMASAQNNLNLPLSEIQKYKEENKSIPVELEQRFFKMREDYYLRNKK
jgi:hypothetical protein